MVAKKLTDWYAATHATSCSIIRPKGKTIEDKSLRRIVDTSVTETRCPVTEITWTEFFLSEDKNLKENVERIFLNCLQQF